MSIVIYHYVLFNDNCAQIHSDRRKRERHTHTHTHTHTHGQIDIDRKREYWREIETENLDFNVLLTAQGHLKT